MEETFWHRNCHQQKLRDRGSMISGRLPPSLTWTISRRYLAEASVSNPGSQACKSLQVQLDLAPPEYTFLT